jgi:Family of unknown function (DUF5329)
MAIVWAMTGTAHAGPVGVAAHEVESLIEYVAGLGAARFRGGPYEVGAANAVRFLRHELAAKGDRVSSAEEFIRWCATRSDDTGRLYEVVQPGGAARPAAELLQDALRQQRAKRP